ncbi:putative L-rhamnose permease RhaY [Lactiplantibacillus plantarum]|nr:putative L-rhamnose permease RhaY [Lactiplantibacillus plantarum]
MFFVVRGSAGIWSIIFPTILTTMGFRAAGTFMIGLLLISLIIGVIWTPQTRGKSLEQITKERYGDEFEDEKQSTTKTTINTNVTGDAK